jgi:urease accessory protein
MNTIPEQTLVYTERYRPTSDLSGDFLTLSLTADERTKTRRYVTTDEGQGIYLRLPRGTVLSHNDILKSHPGNESPEAQGSSISQPPSIRVIAKPEAVLTVRGSTSLDLMKAAYHLGNRHVSVEVNVDCLRLSPDPVLKNMLVQMGLTVMDEVQPFLPETGAYHHH